MSLGDPVSGSPHPRHVGADRVFRTRSKIRNKISRLAPRGGLVRILHGVARMRRLFLAFVLLVGACTADPAPAAEPDAAPDAIPSSFNAPLGAACDEQEASLCAGGAAACVDSVCRPWCGSPPVCPAGTVKHYFTRDNSELCACVPS